MRKELVLILAIVMGAALIVYNWSGDTPLPFRRVRGIFKTETVPAATPEAPGKGAEAKTPHKASRGEQATAAPEQTVKRVTGAPSPQPGESASQPGEGAAQCCPKAERPFPTPEALRTGAASKDLLASYGEPDFHVAGSSSGRVIEKYYYVNKDRSQLTLIIVENGLLTSVKSLPGAYFQIPGPGRPEGALSKVR